MCVVNQSCWQAVKSVGQETVHVIRARLTVEYCCVNCFSLLLLLLLLLLFVLLLLLLHCVVYSSSPPVGIRPAALLSFHNMIHVTCGLAHM